MAEQTVYFNLVNRISTKIDSTTKKELSGFQGLLKGVSDKSYIAGKALQTALGFATYQIVSSAIFGIKDAIQGSIQAFVDFELAMANVSRTVQDFDRNSMVITEFAVDMSTAWGLSLNDVAEAMQFMGSVGMNSYGIMRDFNDVAQMSVALQVDLEDAIQTVVKAQQIWNDEAYTATQVSDILNNMTNRTALNMEFLAGALRMGGPAAAITNTSLEEMTALLVELSEAGFKGTMAGRSLNTILIKMGTEAGSLLEHLTELKSQGFDVNLEAMEGYAEALPIQQFQMLGEATDNLTNSQKIQIAQMVGGTNFLKQFLTILGSWEDLEGNLATALDSRGSTLEEVNKITETTAFQIAQVESEAAALAVELGERLQPALLLILETKMGLIDATINLVDVWDMLTDGVSNYDSELGGATTTTEHAIMAQNDYGLRIIEGIDALKGWAQSQEEVAIQTAIVSRLLKDGTITQREYDVMIVRAREGQLQYTDSLEQSTVAIEEHEKGLYDLTREYEEQVDAVYAADSALVEYAIEVDAVNSATDELNRVLSYLSGEMTQAQFETQELTWYTDEAEAAYGELKYALDLASDAMMATESAMESLSDSMYENNLAISQLRLEQMLLDRAYEEGEIKERQYKEQTKLLNKEMRDLRITGQDLSIQNMILNETYKDQQAEVDDLEGKVTVLKDADEKLSTAMDKLGDAAGLLIEFLKKVEDWMGLSADATEGMEDAVGSLERKTGKSVKEMVADWETYRKKLIAVFNSYDDIDRYLDNPPDPSTSGGGGGNVTKSDSSRIITRNDNGYITYSADGISGWYNTKAAVRKRLDAAGYAKGFEGWVNQPTTMLVGEKGAEYVSVKNQNQMKGGGGGMGNVTVNLPNVTSVEDPAQVRRIFRQVMLQLSGER